MSQASTGERRTIGRATKTMELWDSAVRMVASLALVVALLLGLVALAKSFVGRRWFGPAGTPLIKVLSSSVVGPRKSILLVAVAGDVLIVGATATELVSLGRLTDPEQIKLALGQFDATGMAPARSGIGSHGKNG